MRLRSTRRCCAGAIFRAGKRGFARDCAASQGGRRYVIQHGLDPTGRGIVGRQANRRATIADRNPAGDFIPVAGALRGQLEDGGGVDEAPGRGSEVQHDVSLRWLRRGPALIATTAARALR